MAMDADLFRRSKTKPAPTRNFTVPILPPVRETSLKRICRQLREEPAGDSGREARLVE